MKQTAYIIGATTDMPKLNLAEFNAVEGLLDKHGLDSVKPHDLFDEWDQLTFNQKQEREVRYRALEQCNLVVVMPSYHTCIRAREDHYHAQQMNMKLVRFDEIRKQLNSKKGTNNKAA